MFSLRFSRSFLRDPPQLLILSFKERPIKYCCFFPLISPSRCYYPLCCKDSFCFFLRLLWGNLVEQGSFHSQFPLLPWFKKDAINFFGCPESPMSGNRVCRRENIPPSRRKGQNNFYLFFAKNKIAFLK